VRDQLAALALGRAELVGILRTRSAKEWARACHHATAGRLRLLDACSMFEAHEREHLEQLAASVADLVGTPAQ
jgi:hypothetical protein